MRVVSLLPSATELVCALGGRSLLVGRSEECDYPPSVRSLPVVMRARSFDSDRPSHEIDDRVRNERTQGRSLYELDLELLKTLAPDVLLTQDLCGVCSVTEAEVTEACVATGLAPKIVSLTPRNLENVWDSARTVGAAIERPEEGTRMAADLVARSWASPAKSGPLPRVLVVEWLDPPIVAGLWVPDMIERAGGSPVLSISGEPGQRTDWPALGAQPADLVILSPCSFSVPRTERELAQPLLRRAIGRFAPRLGVWLADEAYFSRPGPRLLDGVELLRALIDGLMRDHPMPVRRWTEGIPAAIG